MLIKPFVPTYEPSTRSPLKRTNLLDRRRIAVSPKGRARIEEIHIDPKEKTITKICSLGSFENYKQSIGNRINIDSSIMIMNDLLTGERIGCNIKSQTPNNSDTKTFQLLNFNEFDYWNWQDRANSTYVLQEGDRVYPSKYVDEFIHESTFNPEFIGFGINSIEDTIQMPYVNFVGLLDSFFTQWGLGYPFDSTITIDTKTKEFTPRFSYCKELIDERSALAMFGTYAKEISKLVDLISHCSLVEKRHFRINIFTNAYLAIIKVTDMDYKEMSFDINSSHCDHFRALVNNKIARKDYDVSEAAGLIVTNKNFGSISSEILESVNYLTDIELF